MLNIGLPPEVLKTLKELKRDAEKKPFYHNVINNHKKKNKKK